ncbi:MAG: 3-oxoacyl-ACP reductase FabG [Gemmataceae bacterium]|jgi:3-oxoacyl-[acyl-carrier protein] reductase|nr:3-oxoacyl-ACP reductase FabG [Gemmataceae bacterium]
MIRYDFSGKVALVTGSSRGIGAAILEQFARAGATCILHYWDDPNGSNRADAVAHAQKCSALGSTVHTYAADVRHTAEVNQLMAFIKEQVGGLDIVVNNAGILRDRTLRKMTEEDWDAVLDTNLDGVFRVCKASLDILRDQGRIVNIASIAGLFPFHGQANYAAAKAGVIALTKVLAKELARRKITVNAIAPGIVQTSMIGDIRPEMVAEYEKQIPIGRIGHPNDIAHVVLFLASEETEYLTGQVIPVTGGWF